MRCSPIKTVTHLNIFWCFSLTVVGFYKDTISLNACYEGIFCLVLCALSKSGAITQLRSLPHSMSLSTREAERLECDRLFALFPSHQMSLLQPLREILQLTPPLFTFSLSSIYCITPNGILVTNKVYEH